ncbi:hypothetical protein [Couchioplanes caeruleus]|nr:hypothetical protein [Couchioplanes caeruleus]
MIGTVATAGALGSEPREWLPAPSKDDGEMSREQKIVYGKARA